jgi:CheY-like chemotaxis protein/HPt (histidine-containing phosphotransfer) domain-containing protein/anti-sigma regulatory factor (Ser/Thr protein kinase)
MNAIIGMAELLLREELSGQVRSYAQDIKQAGNNLVSIINDILDISKIEAGKLDIIPVKYLLTSLINETTNIIRIRIGEKPIRFYTNVDANIPNSLIGDEVRLRQIILNLLSNAIKYSERGYVSMTMTMEKRDGKQVWLKITVTDTGKGIKPENQALLFGEFVQVDTKKNRGIEGTGLGLSITRNLCLLMGGDITFHSEYGKGSTFTALIPQEVESEELFAAVEDASNKKVLVYEGRSVYAKSVCWSLENMKVPHVLVTTLEDFIKALYQQEWFFVFSGYGLYDKIKPLIEQPDSNFPGGKKPLLALMVEEENDTPIPNVRFVSLPVKSLSIANALNCREDSKNADDSSAVIRYTFPCARLLVVDDMDMNLRVAEGFLAPYRATVDTCRSGIEAIEKVKCHDYDIVFMDHLMHGMDGIETTAVIREQEGERFQSLPIIALTANAVMGMREMFIEKGFNDFLAKPMTVSKLDEMLKRWIPKDKREIVIRDQGSGIEDGNSDYNIASGLYSDTSNYIPHSLIIPGVDVQKGITMTGGTEAGYRKILSVFCKVVEKRLPLLTTIQTQETLHIFTIQVHSLKSGCATLGAAELSLEAAMLEDAGMNGDLVYIQKNLNGFTERLTKLAENIRSVLETAQTTSMSYV